VYEITEAGQGILQTAVADLLRQPRSLGSGFELGLANLRALKPRQVYQVLEHHRSDLQYNLEAVEKAWQRHQQEGTANGDHIQALYTHSIALMRAELGWLETFLDDWKTRYPGVESEPPAETDPNSAETRINPRTRPSDPVKMIQRLKRLPRSKDE
jgi:hypothetical protein